MKKIMLLLSLFVFCRGIAQEKIIMNDPNAVLREVGSFSKLVVNGPFKIFFSEAKEYALAVSAKSDETRDHISTQLNNGVLNIGMEKQGIKWWGVNQGLKIYLSAPTLKDIKLSGAVNFYITDVLKSNDLKVSLSGASDVSGKVDADRLTFILSGASDCEVSGHAEQLQAIVSGASSFKGKKFTAKEAELNASGASTIKVGVQNLLNATASGASNINYEGGPSVQKTSSSGASSIKKGF